MGEIIFMRLYDELQRLYNDGSEATRRVIQYHDADHHVIKTILDPNPNVFIADSVAKVLDSRDDSWADKYDADYFGCIAPPFTDFFVEATSTINGHNTQRGFFVHAMTDIDDDPYYSRRANATLDGMLQQGAKWVYAVAFVILVPNTTFFSPVWRRGLNIVGGEAMISLDEHGFIMGDRRKVPGAAVNDFEGRRLEVAIEQLPLLFETLSLLHKRVEVEETRPKRAYKRRLKRKHGITANNVSYTLKVTPNRQGQYTKSSFVDPKKAGKKRRHRVRGHMKYYWPERPLFGHYSGSVWVPPRDKGDEAQGVVHKRYDVRNS